MGQPLSVKYLFHHGKVPRREGLGAQISVGPASLRGHVPLHPTVQKGSTQRLLSMVLKHSLALRWFVALAAIVLESLMGWGWGWRDGGGGVFGKKKPILGFIQ